MIAALDTLQIENALLRNEVAKLKEQLAWFKRQVFGKKSERIVSDLNSEQLCFEGFENKDSEKEKKFRLSMS